jgi:hypothetical protein
LPKEELEKKEFDVDFSKPLLLMDTKASSYQRKRN